MMVKKECWKEEMWFVFYCLLFTTLLHLPPTFSPFSNHY